MFIRSLTSDKHFSEFYLQESGIDVEQNYVTVTLCIMTWQDRMNESVKEIRLEWKDAKSVVGNRTKWRTLVAQCSSGNRMN